MCNSTVGGNFDFHAWSVKNRVPYNLPRAEPPKKVEIKKKRLVFGEKI